MKIILESISRAELKKIAEKGFGELVKAVVDIDRGIMALEAEFHADLEKMLLSEGSKQGNLWGINIYPDQEGEDFIEFDSMINLRPGQGNRSRGVDDPKIREKIRKTVFSLTNK